MKAGCSNLRVLGLSVLSLALAGCGLSATSHIAETTDSLSYDIYTIDSTKYTEDSGRCTKFFFWTKMALRKNFDHRGVGILWSGDHWSSSREAVARFDGEENATHNRFIVQEYLGTRCSYQGPSWGDEIPKDIQFKSFVIQTNGEKRGEPFPNQEMNDGVFPGSPVRRIDSQLRGEEGFVKIRGEAKVFDYPDIDEKVFVRYTLDNWKTFRDAPATKRSSGNFGFEIAIPGKTLPKAMEYTVYTVMPDGHIFWAKNGSNEEHALEPEAIIQNGSEALERTPLSGTAVLFPLIKSSLKLLRTEASLDGVSAGGEKLVVDTSKLSDGNHRAMFTATFEGNIQRSYVADFKTLAAPVQKGEWVVPVPKEVPLPTDSWKKNVLTSLAADTSGKIYAAWDSHYLVRYAEVGASSDDLKYRIPDDAVIRALAVDRSGNLFAAAFLGTNLSLIKFLPSGERDIAFGDYGVQRVAVTAFRYAYEPYERTIYVSVSPDGTSVTVGERMEGTVDRNLEPIAPVYRFSAQTGSAQSKATITKVPGRLMGLVDLGDRVVARFSDTLITLKAEDLAKMESRKIEHPTYRYAAGVRAQDPASLAVDSHGNFWAASERMMESFGANGEFKKFWKSYGSDPVGVPGGNNHPAGFTRAYEALPIGSDRVILQIERSDIWHGSRNVLLVFAM